MSVHFDVGYFWRECSAVSLHDRLDDRVEWDVNGLTCFDSFVSEHSNAIGLDDLLEVQLHTIGKADAGKTVY